MKTSRDNPMLAKAWVLFNGTGTIAITSSFNVTSLTDDGTGTYTINLTQGMASANYVACKSDDLRGSGEVELTDANSFQALVRQNTSETLTDAAEVHVAVFGEQ